MAKYGELTQGSIINNLRVKEYPDVPFLGIVITAKCDIANCKVPKFYYLSAAPVDIWVKTEGVRLAAEKYYSERLDNILKKWETKLPDFAKIVRLPLVEIQKTIKNAKPEDEENAIQFKNDVKRTIGALDSLSKYCCSSYKQEFAAQLLSEKEIQNNVKSILKLIISDKYTHYCFVPRKSYAKNEMAESNSCEGLIVNLLDIAWFDYDTAEKIEKQELDYKTLNKKELKKYNFDFFLDTPEDIIFPEYAISSPYIEWLMQHFSQAFIRIGVDKPPSEDVLNYYRKQLAL